MHSTKSLEYVRSYSTDDEATIHAIDQNSQLIASRLYEQIREYFIQEVISYGETKIPPPPLCAD